MRALIAPAVLALAALGCGGGKVAPVSGRVTLDGKPLANAHVSFQPSGEGGGHNPGSGSYGITDADGRFTLRVVEGDQLGAVVAKHRVEVTLRGAGGDEDTDRHAKGAPKAVSLPERYNRNTELTFEVKSGGSTEANFDLQSR